MLHMQDEWLVEHKRLRRRPCEDLWLLKMILSHAVFSKSP